MGLSSFKRTWGILIEGQQNLAGLSVCLVCPSQSETETKGQQADFSSSLVVNRDRGLLRQPPI